MHLWKLNPRNGKERPCAKIEPLERFSAINMVFYLYALSILCKMHAVCIAFWGDFGVCENTALHLFGYTHWQVCAICSTCHVPCRVSKWRINWCSFIKSLLLLDLDVAPVDDYCSWYSCFQPTLGWVCSDCPPWRQWTSEVLHPPRWIMWYGGFHSHSLFMYI